LIDLSLDEIIEALPTLEQEPDIIWNLIEKHYRPNFFENVVFKKYGCLFEDNTEEQFRSEMIEIRDQIKVEVQAI